MNKRVLVLTFSSRKNGNCVAISRHICNFFKRTNVPVRVLDASQIAPCNGCDYECLRPGVICSNLTQEQSNLMDTLCNSDLVYFVVPNYCGLPCANYYAFNERTVGYFNMDREKMNQYMRVDKRFIIVSNTEGFEQAMQQQTLDAPICIYLKTRQYSKQSINGDLMDSKDACRDQEAFLERDL